MGLLVTVRVGNNVVLATKVKENPQTIWVKLPNGDVVKRHKTKHVVDDGTR